ncbi:MAG: hypothetical protein U0Q22_07185 [Acidimicrobiales bacterium]
MTHDSPALLVYLHGHGSTPHQVAAVFCEPADDGWVRCCPAAAVPAGDGWSWFEEGPMGIVGASLDRAVAAIVAVVEATRDELGIGRDRVVVGGFSQGAALALAVAAALPRDDEGGTLGGLLLEAGFVPEVFGTDFPLTAVAAGSVLVQHPVDDEVVPAFMGKDLAESLGAVPGVGEVELDLVAGGHVVSPDMLATASRWLRDRR